MGELKDIKDMAPNKALVDRLKRMLVTAESGELRSMIYAIEYYSSTVSHGWVIDPRTNERVMLAELMVMQADFVNDIGLMEKDSVLSSVLFED